MAHTECLPGEFPSCRKICDSCRGSKSLAHLDFWPGEERGILERHGYDISLMAPLCPNFYKAPKHLLASKPLSQPKLTSDEMANVLAANEDRKVTKAILIRYCEKLGLTKARKGYNFVFVSEESSKSDLIHILLSSQGAIR